MENRISAAENLIIQADADQWQLFQYDELGTEREQLRIFRDEPLRFSADFALTRRLPAAGKLPAKYVRQVVLGWSPGDQAWHLGLLLASDIAGIRGSRWCEIANWPEPDPVVFEDLAKQAGRDLATVLSVPFSVVPPKPGQQAPPAEPAQLPDLPINIGTWTLDQAGEDLIELRRARRWGPTGSARDLWDRLLSVVYGGFWGAPI